MKTSKTKFRSLTTLLLVLFTASCLFTAACASPAAPAESSPAASEAPAASETASEAPAASDSQESAAPQSSDSGAKTCKVGIVQLAENGSFEDMREGFLNQLAALGYEAEVDYKNAQGDIGTLNTICQEMAKSDNDIIVTIATPAAQAYVSQESDIPLIFISVSNPVGAGIMSSMDTPDHNATGSSNLVPVDEIFSLANKLTPDVKNFGFLYNSGEANAVMTVDNAKKYLDDNGYTYTEATVANSAEIQQAAQALASKVDAIYVPIDSTVQTAMPQVAQIAVEAGIPLYGSAPVMVADGALATVSVNDTQVGAAAADLAAEYLSGTPIKDIPAVAVKDFVVVINKATAAALGIEVDESQSNVVLVG